jgi:release factor glutamine methyltransferase
MNDNKKSFHYQKLKINLNKEVYEPAEDTFLLLESINIKPNDEVLEIGTGSGIIALSCAMKGANVICSDINPYAIKITKQNYNENKHLLKGSFEIRQGNLFSVIKSNEKFDVIIYNPPYLPTKKDEKIRGNKWFDIAVNGGKTGLKNTNNFLKQLPNYLRKNAKAYFIFSSLSDESLMIDYLKKFDSKIVKSIGFTDETLHVYMLKVKK